MFPNLWAFLERKWVQSSSSYSELQPQWDTELSISDINGTCEFLIRPQEPSHEQTQCYFHLGKKEKNLEI